MRILHTSDWHVGKRLGRHDRMDEHREAMAEVARIAGDEAADLVVHSGDLFDRPVPPVDALRDGLDGLVRLADGGKRPVVVVAGNHDSPELFEALAPFLEGFNVHLVGRIKRPDDGGVLSLEAGGATAHVACFPFLRAARAVDFMERADKWYGSYADRVRRLCEVYADDVAGRRGDGGGIGLLVAHFMVGGIRVRTGAPRGERELHMGEAYTATSQAVPTSLDYVAMGHIHAPQPVPGAPVPAEYAGSLLQLDFGEAGEEKRVVLVEAGDGPAAVRSIPLQAGRPLVRASGTWADLDARDDLDDVWLDLAVETGGPEPGLADTARERFPHLVKVTARYERPDAGDDRPEGLPLADLYAAYALATHGEEPADDVMAAFAEVEEEALGAAP
ncbi:MAG: exonuclease SbcCD subunit D [Actinobacteria bacterium]|nr:exonuclease SbcCD subunit D [Actinomycetota bacterium]